MSRKKGRKKPRDNNNLALYSGVDSMMGDFKKALNQNRGLERGMNALREHAKNLRSLVAEQARLIEQQDKALENSDNRVAEANEAADDFLNQLNQLHVKFADVFNERQELVAELNGIKASPVLDTVNTLTAQLLVRGASTASKGAMN